MDLFCPHCTKRVTVPDDKAGQVTSCPLCTKQFMTPSLAPASAPPPPPPSPPPPAPAPMNPPTVSSTSAPTSSWPTPQPSPPPPPPAPVPPGDYTRSFALCLRDWLAFVPVGCIVLILFLLSFFNWHGHNSLWSLAFSVVDWPLTTYVVGLIFCFIFTVVALVLDLVKLPPAMAIIVRWKNLPVAVVLLLALLFLAIDYLHGGFMASTNPILTAEWLAIRLHVLAIIASFGMVWLHLRKLKNLPPPKIEVRW